MTIAEMFAGAYYTARTMRQMKAAGGYRIELPSSTLPAIYTFKDDSSGYFDDGICGRLGRFRIRVDPALAHFGLEGGAKSE